METDGQRDRERQSERERGRWRMRERMTEKLGIQKQTQISVLARIKYLLNRSPR